MFVNTAERELESGGFVGACEDCRKEFGKGRGIWMLVKTAEGF